MKAQLQVTEVERCLEWLGTNDYSATQSLGWLIDHASKLCTTLAFVNNQMAVAKEILNQKKTSAYINLIGSQIANEQYFAPSLAKDYIASQCSDEQYAYDISERCSRTVTHILDTLRTIISALKEESKFLNR